MPNQLIAELWEERARMYRIAYSHVRNEADAMDVTAEAYAKALAKQSQLKELRYAKTWLTRIVINTALDHLRKQRNHLELIEAESVLVESDGIQEQLLSLPLELRTVVFLRFVEDLSLKEIAEVLALPLSTIKHRLYKGLEILRIELSELEEIKNED